MNHCFAISQINISKISENINHVNLVEGNIVPSVKYLQLFSTQDMTLKESTVVCFEKVAYRDKSCKE